MNPLLDKLYALHLVDDRIHRAQQGLAALEGPPPVAAQLQKINAELAKYEAHLHKIQADLKDAELQLRTLEGKREADKQKLYGGKIVGTRELQALEREIEGLGATIATGEERVLAAMERVEPVQANVNKLKEYKKAAEAKLEADSRTRETERKKFQADMAAAQPLREPAAREVDPELLSSYERVRTRRGHPGLAVVQHASCGQCHNSIPSMVMRKLMEGEVVTCDTCSRIYYLPPGNEHGA